MLGNIKRGSLSVDFLNFLNSRFSTSFYCRNNAIKLFYRLFHVDVNAVMLHSMGGILLPAKSNWKSGDILSFFFLQSFLHVQISFASMF